MVNQLVLGSENKGGVSQILGAGPQRCRTCEQAELLILHPLARHLQLGEVNP